MEKMRIVLVSSDNSAGEQPRIIYHPHFFAILVISKGEPQRVDSNESDHRDYARADGAAQPGANEVEQSGQDADLLDVNNWDDVSVQQHSVVPFVPPPNETYSAAPPQQASDANPFGAQNPYGAPPPDRPH